MPQTAGVEDPAGADLLEGFDTEAVQDAGEDRISVTAQDGEGSVDLNNIEDHETEAPQDPAVEETQDAAGAGAAGAPARATEPRPLGTQPTQAEIDAMPEGPEKYATIRGVWTQRDNDNPKT